MKSKVSAFQPSRRAFIKGATYAAGFALTGGFSPFSWMTGHPFKLGVASGSASSQGFVLWTRLAPKPLDYSPDGLAGLKGVPTKVRYEISTDEKMRKIVHKGVAQADPNFGYSVHAEITGLNPARPYWYRFHHGDATSRIGRAMTLPAPGAPIERLKLAFVSCSNYEHGYFSAYRHLAEEHPDGVLFLGDYIYENVDPKEKVRAHSDNEEVTTLAGYRNRYSQYQLDPDLQELRATATSFVTWDDHEVQNDYADQWSQTFDDPKLFLKRRAAAYQAFYENMPVKPSLSTPNGPAMHLYDRFAFGDLVEVSMIDGRQYRSRAACYGAPDKGHGHLESVEDCPELLQANRSLIGAAQEQWLFDGLA
ncbi:MAG: alkaline phosphatase D family protein, partial [Alphaproteobacteria bacterium]